MGEIILEGIEILTITSLVIIFLGIGYKIKVSFSSKKKDTQNLTDEESEALKRYYNNINR